MKISEIKSRIKNFKKDYEQRFMYSGVSIFGGEDGGLKCSGCEELTDSVETFYHKSENKSIRLCYACGLRWRNIKFRYRYKKTVQII